MKRIENNNHNNDKHVVLHFCKKTDIMSAMSQVKSLGSIASAMSCRLNAPHRGPTRVHVATRFDCSTNTLVVLL